MAKKDDEKKVPDSANFTGARKLIVFNDSVFFFSYLPVADL